MRKPNEIIVFYKARRPDQTSLDITVILVRTCVSMTAVSMTAILGCAAGTYLLTLLQLPLIEVGNAVTAYCYSIASYP